MDVLILLFGSLLVGFILLFLGQKMPSRSGKIIIRTIGVLVIFFPFIIGVWNNYIAPLFEK